MRWSASAKVTWPDDADWQRAWQEQVKPLFETKVGPDGTVQLDGEPSPIRLTGGTHLQPGAAYDVEPDLTVGVLRAWVAEEQAVGVEWAPKSEPGRAHVEVHGLDRLAEARAESTLRDITGNARLTMGDEHHLFELEAEVPWLRVEVSAHVASGRLRVDLRLRGLGLWWPTLGPLMTAASGKIQEGLDETVRDLAKSITQVPQTHSFSPPTRTPSFEELDQEHEPVLRAGMTEAARRQHQVGDTLAAIGWWRRTSDRWCSELAALGPGLWPAPDALPWDHSWEQVEKDLTDAILVHPRWRRVESIDTEVATKTTAFIDTRRDLDHITAGDTPPDADTTDAAPTPMLTDAQMDVSWLESPWKTIRHFTSAETDEEAQAHAKAMVEGR